MSVIAEFRLPSSNGKRLLSSESSSQKARKARRSSPAASVGQLERDFRRNIRVFFVFCFFFTAVYWGPLEGRGKVVSVYREMS